MAGKWQNWDLSPVSPDSVQTESSPGVAPESMLFSLIQLLGISY